MLHGPDAAAAWTAWLAAVEEAGGLAPLDGERIPLAEASGRVAAETVTAGASSPAADATLPDGRVRGLGEDVATGDLLLRPGQRLTPADCGLLASAGETAVVVRRRPRVVLVSAEDGAVPTMLAAAAAQAGASVERRQVSTDDASSLGHALEAAATDADLVVLFSGAARGAGDDVATAVAQLGALAVQGVAIRPGFPVALGRVGRTPLLCIPGFAVSAGIAFDRLGVRMLAEIEGSAPGGRPRVRALVTQAMRSTPDVEEAVRARLAQIGDDVLIVPLPRGAGVLASLARADALAWLGRGVDGVGEGEALEVELLRPLADIERTALVTGSTDPAGEAMAAGVTDLALDCRGSGAGAEALGAGRCHAALLEGADVPRDAVVLARANRSLGLVAARGNPLGIEGVADLRRMGLRLVSRPRGSSARRLLDELLDEHRVDPARLTGGVREARSHAAAVAAVAAGAADCTVASTEAAERLGLHVQPLATQELLLVTTPALAAEPRVARLRAALERA